jgi:hypothetical protein
MGRRSLSLCGAVASAIALNLLGGAAMAAAPAKAPKTQDVVAARTVVAAITRFDKTALAREKQITAAANAMVAQVQTGCPGSLPASVLNGTSTQQAVAFDLLFEAAFDLSIDTVAPVRRPGLALAKGLDRAKFSTRAFSRGIHKTATVQRVFVTLTPSDLCGDVNAAAAGGFAADPPGTTAFLKGFQNALSSSGLSVTAIIKKLNPYLVTTRDQASLTRLKAIDARYEKFATNLGVKSGAKLGKVLSGTTQSGGGTGGFPTKPPPPAAIRRARVTAAFGASWIGSLT